MAHLRSTAPINSKYSGIILAEDFKTINDFKDCCKKLLWQVSEAHFKIGFNEKSNQKIIEDYYLGNIDQIYNATQNSNHTNKRQ